MQLNQVTAPALNLQVSTNFYRALGLRLIVSSPHYARFECPEGGSTFSVHLVADVPSDSGIVVYFECDDLDAKVRHLKSEGFEFSQDPRDERWLWREARLRDPAGNQLCLYWAGENRRFPPWRITEQPS